MLGRSPQGSRWPQGPLPQLAIGLLLAWSLGLCSQPGHYNFGAFAATLCATGNDAAGRPCPRDDTNGPCPVGCVASTTGTTVTCPKAATGTGGFGIATPCGTSSTVANGPSLTQPAVYSNVRAGSWWMPPSPPPPPLPRLLVSSHMAVFPNTLDIWVSTTVGGIRCPAVPREPLCWLCLDNGEPHVGCCAPT